MPEGPGEHQRAVERLTKELRMREADAMEAVSLERAPENPGAFTVWGMMNGITSAAKGLQYADGRVALAMSAGSLLATTRG